MWIFDVRTFVFLAVNDAAVKKYGYTRTQFLAMTILDIRPSEDILPLIRKELKEGKHDADHEIWRHRKSDGSLIGVCISSHPITFHNRQAEIVTAEECHSKEFVREVTERKDPDARTL
jgi:PAS domain S-box-containing protein